ncbi:MAG: nicotinamidase [Candidatus Bathyarchaeia archaeon]
MNKTYNLTSSDALLITDIQNDFLTGGALPVPGGDEIIPLLNEFARIFADAKAPIFASRDWHPRNHCSFKQQGGSWPPHCVQDTKGAEFSPKFKLPKDAVVVFKATDPMRESYSVFDQTTFAKELKERSIRRLFVGGLATDYCVLHSVLDARKHGYETIVLMDATRGIDAQPEDVDKAVESMLKCGAVQATTADFPDAVDTLPMGEVEADTFEDKPNEKATDRKKSRMRPRGSSKRLPTERKG